MRFEEIRVRMMRSCVCTVPCHASAGWAQLVFRHDTLRSFVIDAEFNRNATMPIGLDGDGRVIASKC